MAIECPNCSFEISENDTTCPECGNPITENDIQQQKKYFAYSKFANFALHIGQVATLLGALWSLLMIAVFLYKKQWDIALFYYPLVFFTSVALHVTFARVGSPIIKKSYCDKKTKNAIQP